MKVGDPLFSGSLCSRFLFAKWVALIIKVSLRLQMYYLLSTLSKRRQLHHPIRLCLSLRLSNQADIPKPQYLSKKDSELTNEPLWKDSFVIDGEECIQNEKSELFYPDLNGFLGLIRDEYIKLCYTGKEFGSKIPGSAFSYYANTRARYRLLILNKGTVTPSMDQ